MAITVTSYGAAHPALSYQSERTAGSTGTYQVGFTSGSTTRSSTTFFFRNNTQTIFSSTTSSSVVENGTLSSSTSASAGGETTASLFTFTGAVYNSAIVTTSFGETETFIEDTDYEDGGYWADTTYSITNTTRTSSTQTTTEGSAYTTSKDTADKISFFSTTTTQSVTTSTTATATFETFGTSSSTHLFSEGGRESTEYVYAAPNEVLWVASATGFDSRAVLTAVGSTATSHSRKLDNVSLADITTVSGTGVSWPASTQGTLSKTNSFSATHFGQFTTTLIPTSTTFSFGTLTGNQVTTFSQRLPHITGTATTQTFTTTTSSYVESSYSLVGAGGTGLASEAQTAFVTFVSAFPAQRAQRGLTFEQISTKAASTSFAYTRSVAGYSRVADSGAIVAGNTLISTAPTQWVYSPNQQSDFGPFFNVHNLNRRTGGFMTYTDNVSGWITGLTVGSDSSLATTITFAQHRRGRNVPLPGSFEKYTVSKDSFTYTQSTSTESTTSTTTSSTLLALSGQSSLREDRLGFGFGPSQTIGGAAQTGETVFANVIGVAKVNNSTISTFGGTLSSTTNGSATASFVNPLATMYAVPATNTQYDIVTQRNITSMV